MPDGRPARSQDTSGRPTRRAAGGHTTSRPTNRADGGVVSAHGVNSVGLPDPPRGPVAPETDPIDRRRFLATSSASVAALAGPVTAGPPARDAHDPKGQSDPRPPVTSPRATAGDTRSEPNWDERFTLTVGNDSGDLCGRDQRVIQAAVDTVARM